MNTLKTVNFTPVSSSALVNMTSYHFINLFLCTCSLVGSKAVFHVAQDRSIGICLYLALFSIACSSLEVKV